MRPARSAFLCGIYLVYVKCCEPSAFMKMMTDEEGNPGVWDVIHPNYTIFHKEDHTFSDCWSKYDDDFATFYKRIEADIEAAKKVRGIKQSRTSR